MPCDGSDGRHVCTKYHGHTHYQATMCLRLFVVIYDGYSRRIIYLKACDNNRADTVLQFFTECVERLGLPSRVRGDRGVRSLVLQTTCFSILYVVTMMGVSLLADQYTIRGSKGCGEMYLQVVYACSITTWKPQPF